MPKWTDSRDAAWPTSAASCVQGEVETRLGELRRASPTIAYRYTGLYVQEWDPGYESICRFVIERRLGYGWVSAEIHDQANEQRSADRYRRRRDLHLLRRRPRRRLQPQTAPEARQRARPYQGLQPLRCPRATPARDRRRRRRHRPALEHPVRPGRQRQDRRRRPRQHRPAHLRCARPARAVPLQRPGRRCRASVRLRCRRGAQGQAHPHRRSDRLHRVAVRQRGAPTRATAKRRTPRRGPAARARLQLRPDQRAPGEPDLPFRAGRQLRLRQRRAYREHRQGQ